MNKKPLLINIALVFAVLLGFELFCGYLITKQDRFISSNDEYSSNPRGYFLSQRHDEKLNKKIYFIDRSKEPPRLKSYLEEYKNYDRILLIGDSFTYGQGVYLKDNFGEVLKSKWPNPVVVSNVGEGGLDVLGSLKKLKENAALVRPTLVIFGYVLNDVILKTNTNHTQIAQAENADQQESPYIWDFMNLRDKNFEEYINKNYPFFKKSQIINWILQRLSIQNISERTIKHYKESHSLEVNAEGLKKTSEAILEMKALSASLGAKFCVLIFPIFYDFKNYPFSDAHNTIKVLLESKSIKTLDTLPVFLSTNAVSFWVHPTDQHPNEHAHALFAQVALGCAKF